MLRWRLLAIGLIAVAAYIPSLYSGYMTDDFFHLLLLDRLPSGFWEQLNLFGLIKSDEEVLILKQFGLVPWWTSLDLRINFFRPIPSLTHFFDLHLFGRNPIAAHGINLIAYLLVVVLAYHLFIKLSRRKSSGGTAMLAAAIFILDDAHAITVQWLANRNELIAASFMLISFLLYLRFREISSKHTLAWAALAYGCALLSKELSIALPLLIAAHMVLFHGGHSPEQRRILRFFVASLFAISLVYIYLYTAAGHGASSVYYLNPLHDPSSWAKGLVYSFASNAAILMCNVPLHVLDMASPSVMVILALIVAPITFTYWYLAWLWLRHDRTCRFCFFWAFVLQPLIATNYPDPRLLFFPSIGFAYLAARLLQELWSRRAHKYSMAAMAWVFAILHFVYAPAFSQVSLRVVSGFQDSYAALRRSILPLVRDSYGQSEKISVFLINYEPRETAALFQLYLYGLDQATQGQAGGKTGSYLNDLKRQLISEQIHYYALSHLPEHVRVQVNGERSLILEAEQNFFPSLFDQLYMTHKTFERGQTFDNGIFKASIEELSSQGQVLKVRFDFNEPLHSSSYRFIRIRHDGSAEQVFL